MRNKLIDITNGALKEQFDFVPLTKSINVADELLANDVALKSEVAREILEKLGELFKANTTLIYSQRGNYIGEGVPSGPLANIIAELKKEYIQKQDNSLKKEEVSKRDGLDSLIDQAKGISEQGKKLADNLGKFKESIEPTR